MEPHAPGASFYHIPGPLSDPGPYAPLLADLPADLPALTDALHGLLVHIYWAERYGLHLDPARQAEVTLRSARSKLARLLELDPRPLTAARPPAQRLVGNCRDFSLLATASLRAQGYAARARCGFATYFQPDHFEDHWIVEVWQGRAWRQVDTQIDDLMARVLALPFDPLALPPGAFVSGAAAWQLVRRGQADPDTFGIGEWFGWDFVKGNLLRDLLALNKVEVLPWDFEGWAALAVSYAAADAAQLARWDEIAALIVQDNFDASRAFYLAHPELHAPAAWRA